ncbi:MAG TPA: hypothetical protein VIV84_08520 [Burkholderiaceae bacterium]
MRSIAMLKNSRETRTWQSFGQLKAVAANIGLGHSGFDQWVAHAPLIRRLQTRTMILEVVQVRAIDDGCDPYLVRLLAADPIELVFAEEATIDRILRVSRIIDFVGVEDDMAAA